MKVSKVIFLCFFVIVSIAAIAQRTGSASTFGLLQGPTITNHFINEYPRPYRRDMQKPDSIGAPWYKVNGSIITETVLTFSNWFDDRIIDSFWQEYKLFSQKSDSGKVQYLAHFKQAGKTYLFLLKGIYGGDFQFLEEKQFLITDTILHKQTAEIFYKVSSSKAKGYLDVVFNVEKERNISLAKMDFVPFDYSQNAFVNNLSENDLAMIKDKDESALLDTIWKYNSIGKLPDRNDLRKKLEKIKLPSNTLFTSRLFMENDDLWVVGIYDTDNTDERLMLGYKLVGKKFKPALVEIIRKGG